MSSRGKKIKARNYERTARAEVLKEHMESFGKWLMQKHAQIQFHEDAKREAAQFTFERNSQ